MKKHLPTVTVGIPAYNEANNIRAIIESVIAQKTKKFRLTKILVMADGCTDDTLEEIQKIKSRKVRIFFRKKRLGLNKAQNLLFSKVNTDLLVIVNADIHIESTQFLTKLISPIIKNPAVGITSAKVRVLHKLGIVGSILGHSIEIRRFLFEKLLKKNNVYLCHGSARAFSKDMYKNFLWPLNAPEDAYSYFVAKKLGLEFQYVDEADLYISPPSSIVDHLNQSTRYIKGIQQLHNLFDSSMLHQEYKIPRSKLIKTLKKFVLKNPVKTMLYIFVTVFIRLINLILDQDQSKFSISTSSKKWTQEDLKRNNLTVLKV